MSKLQFPAYTKAFNALAEVNDYKREIRRLTQEKEKLALDPKLSPLAAANQFIEKDRQLKDDIRSHQMAVETSEPSIMGLMGEALKELRGIAQPLELDALALSGRVQEAAVNLLANLTENTGPASAGNPVVIQAHSLYSELLKNAYDMGNARSESLIPNLSEWKSFLEDVPSRLKSVGSGLSNLSSLDQKIKALVHPA